MEVKSLPTNQKNWPSVGTIESTLAQYSAIYGNTFGQFSWFVGLRILEVTFDSKLMFEMHLRQVVSKAANNLGIVRRAGMIFDCPRMLKGSFNVYALSRLGQCAPVWMSSAESNLGLLHIIVNNVERLCESELCCFGHIL